MPVWFFSVLLLVAGCKRPAESFGDTLLEDVATAIEPQGVDAILDDAAAQLDPTPRARALHWRLRSGDVATWAPRARLDPSPWVQTAAVDALATRGPDGHDALRAQILAEGADPLVRLAAAMALPDDLADADEEAALADAWNARGAPWDRAPLALAAWSRSRDPDAAKALADAVATGELPLDPRFLTALGERGPSSLVDALATASDKADPQLRVLLAAARLRLGDDRAEADLREALAGEPTERMEALDALLLVDHPAVDGLVRRAGQGASELVQWHVELAEAVRDGDRSQAFLDALAHDDPEVRRLAVELAGPALAHGGERRKAHRDVRRALVEALDDPDASVRARAARVAGSFGIEEAAPALTPLLADEALAVRIEAAGALTLLPEPAP